MGLKKELIIIRIYNFSRSALNMHHTSPTTASTPITCFHLSFIHSLPPPPLFPSFFPLLNLVAQEPIQGLLPGLPAWEQVKGLKDPQ
jgi:hypothetical protein